MLNDNYRVAFIGTHGTGKTYVSNQLKKYFKVYSEAPFNEYMGKNCYLAETQLHNDYVSINNQLSSETEYCVSDRFGVLSVLLYSEAFNRMGWLSDEENLKIVNLVNDGNVDWVLPKRLLYIDETVDVLKSRIIKRGRKGLNEEDGLYLGTVNELYKDYFGGFDVLPELDGEIKKSFKRIPHTKIKSTDSLESIIEYIV